MEEYPKYHRINFKDYIVELFRGKHAISAYLSFKNIDIQRLFQEYTIDELISQIEIYLKSHHQIDTQLIFSIDELKINMDYRKNEYGNGSIFGKLDENSKRILYAHNICFAENEVHFIVDNTFKEIDYDYMAIDIIEFICRGLIGIELSLLHYFGIDKLLINGLYFNIPKGIWYLPVPNPIPLTNDDKI